MRIVSLVVALILIMVIMGLFLKSTNRSLDIVTGRSADTTVAPSPGPGGYIEAAKKNMEEINRSAQEQQEAAEKILDGK